MDVEDLAGRAAGGDRSALDELLRAVQPQVLHHCARYLPCQQDAEEACQDALLRIAAKLPTFEGRSRFSTWMHTVVSNSALTTYRSLKRRAVEQVADADVLAARADPRTTSVIAGSRIDLLDAVERLGEKHPRLVPPFVLRDLSQLTYAEIAEHLQLPLGTVKAQVHEARTAVRPLLAERA